MKKSKRVVFLLFLSVMSVYGKPRPEQRARLLDMSQRLKLEYMEKRAEALEIANSRNWPLVVQLADNRKAELMYLIDGKPEYYITNNLGAARTTRANTLWPGGSLGLSVSGSGYNKLGEWDGGAVLTAHNEFTNSGAEPSRVTQADGAATISWHATHVAGTMIAGGEWSDAIGMAYEAELDAYDWTDDVSEMASAAAAGMEISNHSYGSVRGWDTGSYSGNPGWHWMGYPAFSETEDLLFGFYYTTTRDWDKVAFNAPDYLIVKSAGNDRNDTGPDAANPEHYVYNSTSQRWVLSTTLRDPDGGASGYDSLPQKGVAKNILTVGAVQQVSNYTGPADVVMADFSGWGPADDGRIKPDVVGKGVSVLSAYYDDNDPENTNKYAYANGTSMSSPNVTGTLALLQNYYQSLHSGTPMTAATLKALTIHSADEAGTSTGPDYQFGWGLVNAERAAQTIERDANHHNVIDELILNHGGSYTRSVYAKGTEPLRVSVVWTDPPPYNMPPYEVDPPDPVLVHDLDLRLSRDASVFYAWSLDPANPSNAATQNAENNVDNVEQVFIASPTEGWYTITVDHDNTLYTYNSSEETYTPGGTQNFSLIISGTHPPQPSGLTADNLQRTGADISWTEEGEADTWNIEFGPSGFSQGAGTQIQTASNPFSLTELNNNGEYDVYVQSVTGSETSVWTGPYTFSVQPTPPGHMLTFDGSDDNVQIGNAG